MEKVIVVTLIVVAVAVMMVVLVAPVKYIRPTIAVLYAATIAAGVWMGWFTRLNSPWFFIAGEVVLFLEFACLIALGFFLIEERRKGLQEKIDRLQQLHVQDDNSGDLANTQEYESNAV